MTAKLYKKNGFSKQTHKFFIAVKGFPGRIRCVLHRIHITGGIVPNRQVLLFPTSGNRSTRHWEEKSLPVGNCGLCSKDIVFSWFF